MILYLSFTAVDCIGLNAIELITTDPSLYDQFNHLQAETST